jgi:ankyrin repeat protein
VPTLSIILAFAVLTDFQYAVVFNRVEVAAELIDCGAEVDSLTVQANHWTALQQAAFFKELDVVRFLLPGGDLPSWTCWYLDDRQTEHSSMDIFNLLCESVCPDMQAVNAYGSTSLHIAASNANGSQIDSLVGLGSDIHLQTRNGMVPIHFAIHNGNFSAFSSLVLHYDEDIFGDSDRFGWSLLHWTVGSKAVYLDEIRRDAVIDFTGPREYDAILRDLLQRGVSPQAQYRYRGPAGLLVA